MAAVTVRSFLNGSRKLRDKKRVEANTKIGKAQLYAAPLRPWYGAWPLWSAE